MKYDDAAVIYLNVVEVARANMPTDMEISNTTVAASSGTAENQWKEVLLNCLDGITFTSTGNVLAVSIHQDSVTSSDIRFQAQLEAYMASLDFGIPANPTGFMAANATIGSVILEWDSAPDAHYYILERKLSSDVAFTVVAPDIPGSFSGFTDEQDIEDDTEYIYRLTAFSLGGRSDCVEAEPITTPKDVTPILVSFIASFCERRNELRG